MRVLNTRYLLPIVLPLVVSLSACDRDKFKSSTADSTVDTRPEAKTVSKYAEVNTWLDDFKNFRTAVYQQDVKQMKTYFIFPVFADTTQVWTAIYDGVDEAKRPENFAPTFTEADLEKQHRKLFNDAFIKTLLKVKSEELYKKGEFTTPVIKAGGQSFHMLAQFDKATSSLQLSVMFAGPTDENGEEMSESESATIYFFKVVDNKYMKFDKILFAG